MFQRTGVKMDCSDYSGYDPELDRPWVATPGKPEVQILEWNGNEVQESSFAIPFRPGEQDSVMGAMTKFDSNMLLQFQSIQ